MKNSKIKALMAVLILCVVIASGLAVAIAAPGDSDDPIVTLSYITDTVIPQLKAYIDEKISGSVNQGMSSGSSSGFTLVSVKANHKIIGNEGTEFVLRMGSGTIIATENGGVADLSDGVDLTNGVKIPANHSLLAPKTDSRGLHMDTDGLVLIKGTYTVVPD